MKFFEGVYNSREIMVASEIEHEAVDDKNDCICMAPL